MIMVLLKVPSCSVCADEDAGFSKWSSWTPCSKTCTDARAPVLKFRHRECETAPCSGETQQQRACNLPQCPGSLTNVSGSVTCPNAQVTSSGVCQLTGFHSTAYRLQSIATVKTFWCKKYIFQGQCNICAENNIFGSSFYSCVHALLYS